jgi:hypothetical protein
MSEILKEAPKVQEEKEEEVSKAAEPGPTEPEAVDGSPKLPPQETKKTQLASDDGVHEVADQFDQIVSLGKQPDLHEIQAVPSHLSAGLSHLLL